MANRALIDTPSVTWDFSTGGQAKANLAMAVLANYRLMPLGSTGADLQDEINDIGAGGTIWLQEFIVLTATLVMAGKAIHIYGTDKLTTGLQANADLSLFGSTQQIEMFSVDGVEFANFTIKQDRVAGGSSMRNIGISIGLGCVNIHIHDIHFKDITSDVITIRPDPAAIAADPTRRPHDISVHDCTCNEWYESYINIRQGSGYNVFFYNNTGTVSAGHPTGGVSRPYGLSLALENSNGNWENVHFDGNTLINTMVSKTNSLGIIVGWEGTLADVGVPGVNVRYNRVSIDNNILVGWWHGAELNMLNWGKGVFPGAAYMSVSGNKFRLTDTANIIIDDIAGDADDELVLADNEVDISLGASGITINEIGSFFATTITQRRNRTVPPHIALSSITGTVVTGGTYDAFPGLCEIPSGKLICAYLKLANHTDSNGKIVYKPSSDQGATWDAANDVYNPAGATTGPTDVQLKMLSNGKILLSGMQVTSSAADRAITMIGTLTGGDTPISWSGITSIQPSPWTVVGCSSPPVELPNGDLVLPVYGMNGGTQTRLSVGVVRSTDHGVTWGSLIVLHTDPSNHTYSEPYIVRMSNGHLVVLFRRDDTNDYAYMRCVSTGSHDGTTWAAAQEVIDNNTAYPGRPSMVVTSDDTIFLLTRKAFPITTGYATSRNEGVSFSPFTSFGGNDPGGVSLGFVYAQLTRLFTGKIGAVIAREDSGSLCNIVYQAFTEVAA